MEVYFVKNKKKTSHLKIWKLLVKTSVYNKLILMISLNDI